MNVTSIAWRSPWRNEVKTPQCLPSWMENSIGKKSPPSQKRTGHQQQQVDARFSPYLPVELQIEFLLYSCAMTLSRSPTIPISPISSLHQNRPKTLRNGAYD